MVTVVIALGSNLGNRRYHLRRAIDELGRVVHLVRLSSVYETAPVSAPRGSPPFLNMVAAGWSELAPLALLDALNAIESRLGRVRRGVRNEPRVIDLDLIAYSGFRLRTARLTIPHPRAHERAFVMDPMRELRIGVEFVSEGRPAG